MKTLTAEPKVASATAASRKPKPKRSKLFDVLSPACVKARPTDEARLARFQKNASVNGHTTPVKILTDVGYNLVFAEHQLWIEDFACPKCGLKRRTVENLASCKVTNGSYSERPTGQESHVQCEACRQWTAMSGELLDEIFPNPQERLAYLEKNCRGATPQFYPWFHARFGDMSSLRKDVTEAVLAVLPVDFEVGTEVLLLRIEALDEAAAVTISQVECLPSVAVGVKSSGEPRNVAWHGQTLTATEQGVADASELLEQREKHAQVEREMAQFRARRLFELGLTKR